jgi:hypothetical protein
VRLGNRELLRQGMEQGGRHFERVGTLFAPGGVRRLRRTPRCASSPRLRVR